jgi:hypothetical protein
MVQTRMSETIFRNRRAVQIENSHIRLTVLIEGGHIAEILDKASGVNPLWRPPWPSIEPSQYRPELHPGYGSGVESKLLAGIMGHNLCLDVFGGPSDEEAAAGITVHGESSVAPYSASVEGNRIITAVSLPLCGLDFERRLTLDGGTVQIEETVYNRGHLDRPIAWTQHVTLGPPFIVPGETQFDLPATRSKTFEGEFGDLFPQGVEFTWPHAPLKEGGVLDLRTYTDRSVSAGYTAHLLDESRDHAYFVAWSPSMKVLFGYRWNRPDFPWLGIWEENHSRQAPPWNGETLTRGMEFGVSPMPETRRSMIDRGSMFSVPGYRWIPALTTVRVSYSAFIRSAESLHVPA